MLSVRTSALAGLVSVTTLLGVGGAPERAVHAQAASKADIAKLQAHINDHRRILTKLGDLQKQYLASLMAVSGSPMPVKPTNGVRPKDPKEKGEIPQASTSVTGFISSCAIGSGWPPLPNSTLSGLMPSARYQVWNRPPMSYSSLET